MPGEVRLSVPSERGSSDAALSKFIGLAFFGRVQIERPFSLAYCLLRVAGVCHEIESDLAISHIVASMNGTRATELASMFL